MQMHQTLTRRLSEMNAFKVWSSVIIALLLSSVVLTGCGGYKAPSTPKGVTATPGNSQVTIAWQAVSNAKSYNIYWSTTSGVSPGNGIKLTGVTSPYTHTGLTNGTTYYYVVTAVYKLVSPPINEFDDETDASAQVSCTPMLPVTATPGNGQIAIAWPPVPGATSYNIYWSTTNGVTPANGTKIAAVTSPYIHSGLTNGTTYYYVVTTLNGNSESTATTQVSVTPSD
jgi:fibronectin type 3 domain-containing protein